jgi:hypothetical protein
VRKEFKYKMPDKSISYRESVIIRVAFSYIHLQYVYGLITAFPYINAAAWRDQEEN